MAFSPDGKLVATRGRTAQVWELGTENQVAIMSLDDTSYGLAFSPDSQQLATASDNKFMRIWNLPTGHRALVTIADRGSTDTVPVIKGGWAEAQESSGTCILFAGPEGKAILFKASDGTVLASFKHGSTILSVAVTANCETMATGGSDGKILLWSSSAPNPLHQLSHVGPILSLQFSDDGKSLISASDDAKASVWDVAKGERRHVLLHKDSVHAAYFLGSGAEIALTISPHVLAIWNVASEKHMTDLESAPTITSLSIPPYGRLLALGDRDGRVRVYDSREGTIKQSFQTSKELWSVSLRPGQCGRGNCATSRTRSHDLGRTFGKAPDPPNPPQ